MDAGKHLTRLERETTYDSIKRKWIEIPNVLYSDHDPHVKAQRDGSENIIKRNPLFRESEHISEKNIPGRRRDEKLEIKLS